MQKINRNYVCFFYISNDNQGADTKFTKEIQIGLPVTMEMDISLAIGGSGFNSCSLRFYNLSSFIQKDLWLDIYNQSKKRIRFYLYAGYGEDIKSLPLVFVGDVMKCSSYRASGSVDNITEIQAMSGLDIANYGYANATFKAGTPYADVIEVLINDLPETKVGYLSNDLLSIPRNQTFMGKTWSLLRRQLSGFEIFEDKGVLNVIKDNEIIPGQVQVISEKTGLLGTPRIAEQAVEVDMIFEPGLSLGQIIQLNTNYELIQSQTYKVMSIKHSGIISPTVCGSLKTSVTLFLGNLQTTWKQLKTQSEKKYAELNNEVNKSGWIKPVEGNISSQFGKRTAPTQGASTNHKGIDISANEGTPVKCPYNGVVVNAFINGVFGNYVRINHGEASNGVNISSEYGHLQKYVVKAGQKLSQGEVIGYVGTTGTSTGSHLHFGIMENGKNVNPTQYVRY